MSELPDAIRADVLEHAVDAALRAEAAYARDRKPGGGGHSVPCRDQIRRLIEAAAPLIEGGERVRLCDELGSDHYVTFTADRWTVEHSVECRLSGRMHECDWHATVARIADAIEPGSLGRWLGRWRVGGSVDSEGLPYLVRAEAGQ